MFIIPHVSRLEKGKKVGYNITDFDKHKEGFP
jgi:hypothetical protein